MDFFYWPFPGARVSLDGIAVGKFIFGKYAGASSSASRNSRGNGNVKVFPSPGNGAIDAIA